MKKIIYDIDLDLILFHCLQLGIAFLLSLPIAFNRELNNSGAGLRTFPLVTIAACSFMLVGMNMYAGGDAEARVMYAIITGMGFIGGGAIFKNTSGVSGTATAAGIWNTGAIGVSVAYGRYEIAIVLSLFGYLIFQASGFLKKKPFTGDSGANHSVYSSKSKPSLTGRDTALHDG